jgi:hypothetical protein
LTDGQVAEIWHRLIVDVLGYERSFAHGRDLGAGVTARLAPTHPEVVTATHLATPGLGAPPEAWSAQVRRHLEEVGEWSAEEGGYSHIHSTKPSTLAVSILDESRNNVNVALVRDAGRMVNGTGHLKGVHASL